MQVSARLSMLAMLISFACMQEACGPWNVLHCAWRARRLKDAFSSSRGVWQDAGDTHKGHPVTGKPQQACIASHSLRCNVPMPTSHNMLLSWEDRGLPEAPVAAPPL